MAAGKAPAGKAPTRKPPARKVAGDFDEPSRAPNKSENAQFKRQAQSHDQELADIYEAGRKEGAGGAGKKKPSSSSKGSGGRRKATPGARSARTAVRQLQAPVRAQVTSGLRILGITLAIVALYNVLTAPGPQAISGVLGGFTRALHWLSSPLPVPERH